MVHQATGTARRVKVKCSRDDSLSHEVALMNVIGIFDAS